MATLVDTVKNVKAQTHKTIPPAQRALSVPVSKMKINHLNLSVPDVSQTARFFADLFGLHITEQKGRDTLAVLYDDDGFALVLSNFDRKTIPSYPRDFHLGFIQQNREQVSAIHARLLTASYALKSPQGMHGSWGFYFQAPGGILVEVSCPESVAISTEQP
jgi:catechol 2,3-dioxygenase-like lactoylglutathione lyase family enzyme